MLIKKEKLYMQEKIDNNTEKNSPQRMSPRRALILSLLIPVVFFCLSLAVFGDNLFLFSRIPAGKEHRAAVVIRDPESRLTKWVSKVLTEAYFRDYYDAYWYYTQQKSSDYKQEFTKALEEALNTYPNVDIYLMAHTNKYHEWAEPLPQDLRQRIRFVYNSGCYDLEKGEQWIALGADSYVGHPGKSYSQYFFVFFFRHWMHGENLSYAVDISNHRMYIQFLLEEVLDRTGLDPSLLLALLDNRSNSGSSSPAFDAERATRESIAVCVGDTSISLEAAP